MLVEYALPDDVTFDSAAGPLMDALRHLSPVPPEKVTAFIGDVADAVIKAGAQPGDDGSKADSP